MTKKKSEKSVKKLVSKKTLTKPGNAQAMVLVQQVMHDFIVAKRAKTMESFFKTIAKVWQDITTIEKLNTAFANVIADSADWGFLETIEPTIIRDAITDRGDFMVVGAYSTKPKKLIFEHIFVDEDGKWKLAEIKFFTAD